MVDRTPGARKRELDKAVHGVLLVGGALSAILLLAAVALSIVERRPLSDVALSPAHAWRSLLSAHPGGLASLGLILLILTPVVRVLGSVVVFFHEGDHRYAAVTLVVLALMVASFLLGHG